MCPDNSRLKCCFHYLYLEIKSETWINTPFHQQKGSKSALLLLARKRGTNQIHADCLYDKAVKAFLMLATNAEKLLVSLSLSCNSAIQSRGGVQEVTS